MHAHAVWLARWLQLQQLLLGLDSGVCQSPALTQHGSARTTPWKLLVRESNLQRYNLARRAGHHLAARPHGEWRLKACDVHQVLVFGPVAVGFDVPARFITLVTFDAASSAFCLELRCLLKAACRNAAAGKPGSCRVA